MGAALIPLFKTSQQRSVGGLRWPICMRSGSVIIPHWEMFVGAWLQWPPAQNCNNAELLSCNRDDLVTLRSVQVGHMVAVEALLCWALFSPHQPS